MAEENNNNEKKKSDYETLEGVPPETVTTSTGFVYQVQHRKNKRISTGQIYENINLFCALDKVGVPRFGNRIVLPMNMINDDWKALIQAYNKVTGSIKGK